MFHSAGPGQDSLSRCCSCVCVCLCTRQVVCEALGSKEQSISIPFHCFPVRSQPAHSHRHSSVETTDWLGVMITLSMAHTVKESTHWKHCHVLTLVPLFCLCFSMVRVWAGVGSLCFFFYDLGFLAWYGSQPEAAVNRCPWLRTILR